MATDPDTGVTYKRQRTGPLFAGYFNKIGLPGVKALDENGNTLPDNPWGREQIRFDGDASQLYWPPDMFIVENSILYLRTKNTDGTYSRRRIGLIDQNLDEVIRTGDDAQLSGLTITTGPVDVATDSIAIGDPNGSNRHTDLAQIITDIKETGVEYLDLSSKHRIYTAQPGESNAQLPIGQTAPQPLGFGAGTRPVMRFLSSTNVNEGFNFENTDGQSLVSIRSSDGRTYVGGELVVLSGDGVNILGNLSIGDPNGSNRHDNLPQIITDLTTNPSVDSVQSKFLELLKTAANAEHVYARLRDASGGNNDGLTFDITGDSQYFRFRTTRPDGASAEAVVNTNINSLTLPGELNLRNYFKVESDTQGDKLYVNLVDRSGGPRDGYRFTIETNGGETELVARNTDSQGVQIKLNPDTQTVFLPKTYTDAPVQLRGQVDIGTGVDEHTDLARIITDIMETGVEYLDLSPKFRIYTAQPGASNAQLPDGQTAPQPLGFGTGTRPVMRFLSNTNVNEGFTFENTDGQSLVSIRSSDGQTYVGGQLVVLSGDGANILGNLSIGDPNGSNRHANVPQIITDLKADTDFSANKTFTGNVDLQGQVDLGAPGGSNRHTDLAQIVSDLKDVINTQQTILEAMRKISKYIPSGAYIPVASGHIATDPIFSIQSDYKYTTELLYNLGNASPNGVPRLEIYDRLGASDPYVGFTYVDDFEDTEIPSLHFSVIVAPNNPAYTLEKTTNSGESGQCQIRFRRDSDNVAIKPQDGFDYMVSYKPDKSVFDLTPLIYTANQNTRFSGPFPTTVSI